VDSLQWHLSHSSAWTRCLVVFPSSTCCFKRPPEHTSRICSSEPQFRTTRHFCQPSAQIVGYAELRVMAKDFCTRGNRLLSSLKPVGEAVHSRGSPPATRGVKFPSSRAFATRVSVVSFLIEHSRMFWVAGSSKGEMLQAGWTLMKWIPKSS
jgi:hypothetical protein